MSDGNPKLSSAARYSSLLLASSIWETVFFIGAFSSYCYACAVV